MDTFSFLPFQNLKSERLILRQIVETDIEEVFALRSNAETMKYIPRPLAKTLDDALAHIKLIQSRIETNEGINWAVTLNGNDKFIGIASHHQIYWHNFRSEIGYMLLPEFHGQGIITEVVKLITEYGFNEMKMHSIEAIIDPRNIASARVLEKNNFIKEAHFTENEFYNGEFVDTAIYSLIKR